MAIAVFGCHGSYTGESTFLVGISKRDDGFVRLVSGNYQRRLCDLLSKKGEVLIMAAGSWAAADVAGKPELLRYQGTSLASGGTLSAPGIIVNIERPAIIERDFVSEDEAYVKVTRNGQTERFRALWSC
jgi:hypothetical protein